MNLHKTSMLAAYLFILLVFSLNAEEVSADIGNEQNGVSIFLPFITSDHSSWSPGNSFRTVNATYFNSSIVTRAMGIFWFGEVMGTENYADVRVGYTDIELVVDLRIIDRQIWYDDNFPSVQELTNWDAVSLFLSVNSEPGSILTKNEYKIVSQLNTGEDSVDYQAVFRGNNNAWLLSDVSITSDAGGFWQQDGGPNDNQEDDFGWKVRIAIPFESLGVLTPPHNELWRLGVVLHDRDDAPPVPSINNKTWPESLNPYHPETWGGLHFGQISDPQWAVSQPIAAYDGVTTIKHGINDAVVPDAHVGGAFNCGDGLDVWTQWGNTNYEIADKINIQNQTLVGDWPCFSKYFITFPLEDIPEGKIIDSAALTMYHFGNSGGGDYEDPYPSWIQVLTITEDWEDTTITWNNAPLGFENIAMTQVMALDEYPGWPGVPINWDVGYAVDSAYRAGQPLRLALYSADSEMHSGKYFYSSDSNSDGSARPTLTIYWHNP